ncbi:MAG: hypothetical protein HGB28_04605 [Oscillochloris sp.]|nr:hypothetical protein [Oscillochloris sp.]
MRGLQFNWRWAALIIFIALLASARSLPWPVTALTLGAGGIYLIVMAWRALGVGGRGGRGGRVTYWRGQRIEMPGPDRRPRSATWAGLAPAVIYALLGVALILGAVVVVLGQAGL